MKLYEAYRMFKARPNQPATESDRYGVRYAHLMAAIVLHTGRLKECQTDADLDAAVEADRAKRQRVEDWHELHHCIDCLGVTARPVPVASQVPNG